jgi:AcrR family transcriptional regulator
LSSDYSGRGDPQITLSLLWGEPGANKPGRKPRLTVGEISEAAMVLADAGGIEKLSMRTLGEALGLSTMALYRYVPGKPELLDLIIDRAYSELPQEPASGEGWEQRLECVARDEWALYLAHPWMLGVSNYRAPLGPNGLRKYERELQAIAEAGLDDLDMDLLVTSLSSFVRGAARFALEGQAAPQQTGQTDAEWWEANAQLLGRLARPEDFPLASRVGTAVGTAYDNMAHPVVAFEFGLRRFIDGAKALAAKHSR